MEFSSGSATGTRTLYSDDSISYIRVQAKDTNTAAPNYAGFGDMYIGQGSIGKNQINMDDLYLFTRALSVSELGNIYDTDPFDRAGLVFLFRFNYQEPWAWTKYAQNYGDPFSLSTSVIRDELDNNFVELTGSVQLEVGFHRHPCKLFAHFHL